MVGFSNHILDFDLILVEKFAHLLKAWQNHSWKYLHVLFCFILSLILIAKIINILLCEHNFSFLSSNGPTWIESSEISRTRMLLLASLLERRQLSLFKTALEAMGGLGNIDVLNVLR